MTVQRMDNVGGGGADGRRRPARPGAAHPSLPIPVERAAFDLAQRGYRESDGQMLDDAASAYEWIAVTHGQRVTVVAMDGAVAHVGLFDGPHAGHLGWLKVSQLAP